MGSHAARGNQGNANEGEAELPGQAFPSGKTVQVSRKEPPDVGWGRAPPNEAPEFRIAAALTMAWSGRFDPATSALVGHGPTLPEYLHSLGVWEPCRTIKVSPSGQAKIIGAGI